MMGDYNTIIFDVGGTLLTSNRLFFEISKLLRPDSPDEINSYFSERFGYYYKVESLTRFRTITECMSLALKETALKFGVKDVSEKSKEYYRWGFVTQGKAYAETITFLEEVKKRNLRMIVATDADKDIMDEELIHFGIKKYFERVIISDEIKAYKPNRVFIEEILKHVPDAHNALFVGDSECDVQTGINIGATPILVDRHGKSKVSCNLKVSNLNEILPFLH